MEEDMPKDLQKWEATRQKGKIHHLLVTGVLSWGVPMFFVMTFIMNRKPERPLTADMIAISALGWTLGGALFGLGTWSAAERKYQKYLSARNLAMLTAKLDSKGIL
jgi:hypothetical protein